MPMPDPPLLGERKEFALDLNFFVVLSHELSQPLAAAIGSPMTLKRIGPDSDLSDEEAEVLLSKLSGREAAKLLGIAVRNLEQLHSLLDSLRIFSEAETGTLHLEVENVPARLRLTEAVEDFGAPASRITMNLECDPDLQAKVSLVLFRQVLANLVNNAAKFSPDGSNIAIEARADGGELVVSVSDEGEGFPPEEAERIFGKNVRLQPGKKGLGVGLFVAKAIVEAHGGRIWAENTDAGAKFSVAIPAVSTGT